MKGRLKSKTGFSDGLISSRKKEISGRAANRTGGRLKTAYAQAPCPLLT